MSAKVSLWTLLPDSPTFAEAPFLASMNNKEILVVDRDTLWKYHCITHKWTQIMKISMNLELIKSLMFDKDTQSLYFCNVMYQLFKVDIKTKQKILLAEHPDLTGCSIFKIDDGIHCISRSGYNDMHMIFNETTTRIHWEKYSSDSVDLEHPVLRVNTRNSMIGTGVVVNATPTELLEYSFTNKDWVNSGHLEWIYWGSQLAITSDERYLFLMGGVETSTQEFTNNISVLDFKTMILTKSYVKLPMRRITVNVHRDSITENLLTFGYINQLWKFSEYSDMAFLSFYLMKLIESWIHFEYAHIIGTRANKSRHWKINVDEILK